VALAWRFHEGITKKIPKIQAVEIRYRVVFLILFVSLPLKTFIVYHNLLFSMSSSNVGRYT
jgi:hypothetical protein